MPKLGELLKKKQKENPFVSLSTAVRDILAEQIISYECLPGEKLTVTEIAEEMGISRTPVVNALNQMVDEGLVVLEKNKGYAVAPFNAKDLTDYIEFRTEIEAYAARVAAVIITPDEIQQMKRYKNMLISAFQHDNKLAFEDSLEFHKFLVDCSHNKYLIMAFQDMIPKIRRTNKYFLSAREDYARYITYHDAIYHSLKLHDPEATEANVRGCIRSFIEKTKEANNGSEGSKKEE